MGLVCFRIDSEAVAADVLLSLDLDGDNLVVPLDNELHLGRAWRAPFSRMGFLSGASFQALNWLMISLSILIFYARKFDFV